ncbi:MAG: hypothetical protein IH595_14295 [Bacteroidales bacterium]|nr:hypothetical protein [Bacteroidales bacterium]
MESNKKYPRASNGRLVFGGLLVIAGAIIMLGNFAFIDINLSYYIFNWKSFLIYLGLYFLATRPNKNTAYVFIGLGILFWFPSIFGQNVSLGDVFWPLILIAAGYLLITRQHNSPWRGHRNIDNDSNEKETGYLDHLSFFGGSLKIVQSKNFKGGNITAIFGGSEFDLTHVEMESDTAVIDVFALFGGTKFIVPEGWRVQSDAVTIFGGFTDKRRTTLSNAEGKVLIIKGLIILGGVEVKSF